MASRHEGLDLDHVKLVIERLSKFHAASAVLQENNGPYSDSLSEGMYNDKLKPMMDTYFNSNLVVMKESIKSFVNGERYLKQMVDFSFFLSKKMSDKMFIIHVSIEQENYKEKCFDKCKEITASNPNGFNVLNHGDLWTNNLMFKYDKDTLTDMLFVSTFLMFDICMNSDDFISSQIDLQLSVWGSPAIDLHYFIVSSAEKKLKTEQFDTIVQYYHDNLVKTLQSLGYKKHIPTLLELQIDLLQRGLLGLMAAFSVLPISLLKDCEDADINNMLDEGDAGMNFKRKLYCNPPYVSMMEMLLAYFDKKGILQI